MLKTFKRKIKLILLKNKLKMENVHYFDKGTLKYLFIKHHKNNKLLVIFSGFPPRGKSASYNYLTKLNNIRMNKLFILDDFGSDNRGSYYLGQNMDFLIEKAVHEVIEKIIIEIGINKSDVITAGSSKGGFASLFFTFKYGYGASISGAPQYLLGDYLALPEHKNIMKYICGDSTNKSKRFLNEILSKEIENSSNRPKVFIHVSKNEHHYIDHVIPLIKKMKSCTLPYNLDLGNYEEHGEVGKYFPDFLKKSISEINQSRD